MFCIGWRKGKDGVSQTLGAASELKAVQMSAKFVTWNYIMDVELILRPKESLLINRNSSIDAALD